ncbi:MAG: cyclic nucleotide-binding domain-containing protein [Ardenticatenaceae bacterium]|nr:cyclic nucleotide-binding domain-containing protein [Ardenticatenaceae bacterium]MCB8990017.1 cyclic nucleotide-binding domain-containing protein [Ardenticatenaceae bacterium]
MTSRLDFLAQLPIFQTLTYEEIEALAGISQEYAFENDAIIAYQRDVADSLYILRSGRLFAKTVDEQGITRGSRSYLPGDYFGERWLFAPDAQPATVLGKGNGRVLIIKGSDFLQFLDENKQVLPNLEPVYDQSDNILSGLSEEAWQEVQKIRAKGDRKSSAISLLPDELVEYQSRRSRYNLLLRLLLPGSLIVLALMLIYVFLPTMPTGGMGLLVSFGGSALILFVLLLWLGFNYLDWRNDYFVITNKHLVHREFNLRTFRTDVVKISIDKVQSVEIDKPNLLTNLFNIGTARITTAAQAGTVYFDNIDDPTLVRDTLNRLSERVKALDAGREQAVMRESVEKHFQAKRPLQVIEDEDVETSAPVKQGESFSQRLRRRYKWRVEENGVITYRKHLFVLLRNIAWPLGLLLFISLGLFAVTKAFMIPINQFWPIALLLITGDLAWLVWNVEDWRNDTFQLTDRLVIDIDRRPFGFGESRKQAALSNIQNVNASRPGLLQTIFNFGMVSIETAGAESDITFEDIPQPSVIQSDIFKRLDEFQQKQRVKEGAQRRKEYAVLLDVYKQAMEQGRIPRRTPPPNEFGL